MKKYINDLKYCVPLFLLLLFVFVLTWAHQGHIIIDCGREVYYPEEIVRGKVLYKDLFNIYGPFAYLFNALLFKIFSVKLSVIYLSGIFTASGIILMIYLISRLFFEKLLSFSITLLSLVISCFSFSIFNYIFPYSFGMSYGCLSCLISLYFLILFIRNQTNYTLYYLSTFFAGIAVANKYEFIPYCFIYLFLCFKNKLKFRVNIIALLSFLFMPVLCFGILFYQGLSVEALFNNFKDIYHMSQTVTLRFFYISSGLIFQKPTLSILLRNCIKTALPLFFLYIGLYFFHKYKIKSIFALIIGVIFAFKFISVETFIFLPFLIFILFCFFYKKTSFENKIFSISVLLMSLKVFWATAVNSYGVFFIPILLIALISYLKKDFYKSVIIYLFILSVGFFTFNYNLKKEKTVPISSSKGLIYAQPVYNKTAQELVNYINANTKISDKVLILPEGLFFNFLTDRKSDDYYNSYLPLYVETFGDERLITSIKQNKPDYIFIHNFPTTDYYFKSICKDYAFKFCEFINNEYMPKDLLLNDFKVYVFEKK